MNAMDQAQFKSLSPDIQKMWKLWSQIDKENPPMFAPNRSQ